MTERQEKRKVRINTLDATLTRIVSARNKHITMKRPVSTIATWGVLNRAFMRQSRYDMDMNSLL